MDALLTSHWLRFFMLHHPAWAVSSYSSSPVAAGNVGTKSMGCFYRFEWSPCMWNAGSPKSWKFRRLDLSMHQIRVSMVSTTWNFTTGSSKTRRKCPYKPASCNASNVSGLNVHYEWPNVHHVQMFLMSKCPWYGHRFHIWLKLSHEVTHVTWGQICHMLSQLSRLITLFPTRNQCFDYWPKSPLVVWKWNAANI